MGGVRRAHVAALGAGAALLLLLLTRLPPQLPAPSTAALPLAQRAPQQTQEQTQPRASSTAASALVTTRVPASSPPAPAAPARAATRAVPYVLTRSVYAAGHAAPHPELCPALGARLRLLVLVASAPEHAAARDAVRLTWGHYAMRSDTAIAFVLGAAPPALRPRLAAEDRLYGDLIVGRSVDTYSNLTLKTLSMLEWVDTYCPRVPHVLKTDDDMFINVPRLLDFVASPLRANASRTIWGKVMRKGLPKRIPKSKYYLSPQQYPGRVLPDFTTGPAYLLTRDAVPLLLAAAPPEPYLRLEDVFVTGVLAQKLGIRRQHAAEFYNKRVTLHPCVVQRGIAIHMVRYPEQFDLWRKLLDGKTKCAP